VLSQLAEDGLMNPMNGRAIRQLIRRGLIVQDPAVRIMNESFRRFFRSATTLEMKQRWVAESRRSGWGKVRGAFFATMIVLGIFLLMTQNALWQSSAAYVTTAFGALGTLAKLSKPALDWGTCPMKHPAAGTSATAFRPVPPKSRFVRVSTARSQEGGSWLRMKSRLGLAGSNPAGW